MMDPDAQVRRLLEAALEPGSSPEAACRDFPELLGQVRERWQRVRALSDAVECLFPSPSSDSPEGRRSRLGLLARERQLPLIPGYSIEGVLGHGGMGVVYRAVHLKLERPVAIKMVLAGALATRAELECLTREARAVAGLRHPNIVQVHDVGEVDGLPYFTMELVEGGTLAAKLKGAPMGARHAAELTAVLAGAVQAAHDGGIVHRDLKPANVLWAGDSTPKIVDFSLARRFGAGVDHTLANAMVGTPSYMAPEQALGRAEAFGPAVDVYALGAILYELLTGRPPFRAQTPAETQRQVISEEPVAPSRLNAGVPRDVETIALKCLSKDAKRRYGSAAELAADLRRFLNGEPTLARPAGPAERAFKWVRRRPSTAALAVCIAALMAGALGAVLWVSFQHLALRRGVGEDMAEVARCELARDWNGARRSVERAKLRLGDSGAKSLREQVEAAQRDLDLVGALQEIRLRRAGSQQKRFDRARSWNEYQEAFKNAGLTTGVDTPAEVAGRIRASAIRSALIEAVDDWTWCCTDVSQLPRLLAIARLADPDPAWGDKVRDLRAWKDAAALAALAENAPIAERSVSLMHILAGLLHESGGDAAAFVRRVQAAHPDDFWANMLAGEELNETDDPDAIGYFRAAIACAPLAVSGYVNLGTALSAQKRLREATQVWERALQLSDRNLLVHLNLALAGVLRRDGRAALEHGSLALEMAPDDWLPNAMVGDALFLLARYEEAKPRLERAIELADDAEPDKARLRHVLSECERLLQGTQSQRPPAETEEGPP